MTGKRNPFVAETDMTILRVNLYFEYRPFSRVCRGSGTATNTATTNGHWVKTELDGLGRTVHSVTGYGTGTGTIVSTVDTTYAPCGCADGEGFASLAALQS